jgi:dCMP deaminase
VDEAVRAAWRDTYLEMARVLAEMRADCTRRKVGAIVFEPDTGYQISSGYNGAPRGLPGCLSDGACPRGQHYEQMGIVTFNSADFSRVGRPNGMGVCGGCGAVWPCGESVAPSSSYDTGPGSCIAIHAEANALLRAGPKARGMIMVVTEKPCDGCLKLCRGAGLDCVLWPSGSLNVPFDYEQFPKPSMKFVFD